MKKIAHVTLFFGNQLGILNKLESLALSSIRNNIGIDFYWITSNNKDISTLKNLKIITIKSNKNILIQRKHQVDILNGLSNKYYRIIIRYPLFDPIILLYLKNKKKYYFEHHTKEIEELFLKKDKRYYFEKFFGSMWLNLFGGLIGVTPEIVNYEIKRSNFNGFSIFCPNSINIISKKYQGSIYKNNVLNIIIVANFRPWHGLNNILNEIKIDRKYTNKYKLHIVGKVENNDLNLIRQLDQVIYYGEKSKIEIERLYESMDIGLGVFNAKIKNLNETTSLKVREYLSNGLPVFMGDIDPAFPYEFKYIKKVDFFNLNDLFNYVSSLQGTSKNDIVNESKIYIDSKYVLSRLYNEIIRR